MPAGRVKSFSSIPERSLNEYDFWLVTRFTVIPYATEHIYKN